MNDYAINHRASRPLLDGTALDGLHGMLELELLDRAEVPVGSWGTWGVRPARLAATLV